MLFYSIREAIELSTTLVYLSDMPDKEKTEMIKAWKSNSYFPMQGQMIKKLSANGEIFADMKKKMPSFFDNIKTVNKSLNKFVPKQGFEQFYCMRTELHQDQEDENLVSKFLLLIKKTIGIVAVMRLAIDPLPVLLMDEEISYRLIGSVTIPYSEEFIKEYIGENTIRMYKNTNLYTSYYDYFIQQEKKNEATFEVMELEYINTAKQDEIIEQIKLLSFFDYCAVKFAFSCNKIKKISYDSGISEYITDRVKDSSNGFSWKERSV